MIKLNMAKHGCEPNKMLDRTAECFITLYILRAENFRMVDIRIKA